MTLAEYVADHAVRGACKCGRCIDIDPKLDDNVKNKHTVNLTFFEVGMNGDPDKESFLRLAKDEFPGWFDGEEHSYIHVGGDMGDQGIALMTIGLGHLLGAWMCMCPEILMPFLPPELKSQMAGSGMVSLKTKKE